MATRRRKRLAPRAKRSDDTLIRRQFMDDLLAGRIHPVQLFETRDRFGRLDLEYLEDDN